MLPPKYFIQCSTYEEAEIVTLWKSTYSETQSAFDFKSFMTKDIKSYISSFNETIAFSHFDDMKLSQPIVTYKEWKLFYDKKTINFT